MKPGDLVYRVGEDFRGNLTMFPRTVKQIRKDGIVLSDSNAIGYGSAWGYDSRVAPSKCAATPSDAAMDYLQRCNLALIAAEKAVEKAQVDVLAARAFAVEIERTKP